MSCLTDTVTGINVVFRKAEAERAFSVAGRFLTKLRTRMLDSTLDGLVFLNHAFKAKE